MIDIIQGIWDLLLADGYRTGAAFLLASVSLVLMINLGTWVPARPVITLGAFSIAWLGYNTFTGQDTPLYGNDARLWDVATQDSTGFLIISLVVGSAAIFVWRFQLGIASRLLLMAGALFGTSAVWGILTEGYEAWQTTVA